MTVLRLQPIGGRDIDRTLAQLGSALLARKQDGMFLEVSREEVLVAIRELALSGVQAVPDEVDLSAPRGAIAAVGLDLVALGPQLLTLDTVRVRPLTIGEATDLTLRRRFAWLRDPSGDAQDRCRALLRGEESMLVWDRRAFGDRRAIRDRRVTSHLRPVVFDRDALRTGLPRRALASQGLISRWLFG